MKICEPLRSNDIADTPLGPKANGSRKGPIIPLYPIDYQAQKFTDEEHFEKIRTAKTPRNAKSLGRSRKVKIRQDWEHVKDDIMRKAVRAKFETHDDLREILLATGDRELIENAPRDYYWGCGALRTGKNMLGKILMEVREQLRVDK